MRNEIEELEHDLFSTKYRLDNALAAIEENYNEIRMLEASLLEANDTVNRLKHILAYQFLEHDNDGKVTKVTKVTGDDVTNSTPNYKMIAKRMVDLYSERRNIKGESLRILEIEDEIEMIRYVLLSSVSRNLVPVHPVT